jgi:hypothetical protein
VSSTPPLLDSFDFFDFCENMAVSFTALNLPVIMTKATSLYPPSVYNGTGTESKLNLVLSVEDKVRDQIAEIEKQLDLGPSACSAFKNGSLKCKIDLDRLNTYDENHQLFKPTLQQYAGVEVEVRLELRGTWKTASSAGLSIRCTDIRFCSEGKASPFL